MNQEITLDDLKNLYKDTNDYTIGQMIKLWEKGHRDIAMDVIRFDYDKVRMNETIVKFFQNFEETEDIFS